MSHSQGLGTTTTNKVNVLLGMKDGVERETYQEAAFCHFVVLETRNAFELSYEG